MIETLLPRGAVCAESFTELAGELHPAELAATHGMREARRDEFVTGRVCARRALARLGHADTPVPRGFGGAPCWPVGIVGSITHCRGYRVAVVASQDRVAGIGVDAEPHLSLPAGVLESIVADDDERQGLDGFPDRSAHADRMLFCAKEAVFKLWFPLRGQALTWRDVSVTFGDRGSFFATIDAGRASDERLRRLSGRWRVSRGFILTAVALDPSGSRG